MSSSTYLSNPVVTINSVDLTDQATSATLTVRYDALESTAFGDTAHKFTAGLGNHELTVDLYMSYAASETYATLAALVGTTTTVKVKPASGSASATNPEMTLTGAYLEALPVANAAMGTLSTISLTFKGGVYSVATS